MTSFKEDFQKFIKSRAHESLNDMLRKDPSDIKHSKKINKLIHRIKDTLGEKWHLVFKLEDMLNLRNSYYIEHAYRQGVRDGIQLWNMLEVDAFGHRRRGGGHV